MPLEMEEYRIMEESAEGPIYLHGREVVGNLKRAVPRSIDGMSAA